MSDCRILEWLSLNTENFRLWHNAQRESAISVERYLLHREHIQEPISFVDGEMRRCAIRSDSLWEISVRHLDGDCQDFRVWPGIMGNKESHYVTTQRTCHTE